GGDERELFVAGEAEVDEPLAVEGAGHHLQEPDAPLTVLHQLVVGRQDCPDAALRSQVAMILNAVSAQLAESEKWLRRASLRPLGDSLKRWTDDQVVKVARINDGRIRFEQRDVLDAELARGVHERCFT